MEKIDCEILVVRLIFANKCCIVLNIGNENKQIKWIFCSNEDIISKYKNERFISNNMNQIREKLYKIADEEYKKFHSSLCPNVNNIIGVRIPNLRQLAKEIAKENTIEFFN